MSHIADLARYFMKKRLEKGISEAKLAVLTGVDEEEIRDFEAGNYPNIDINKVFSICRALDLYRIPIVKITPELEERLDLINELMVKLKGLNDEELKLFSDLLIKENEKSPRKKGSS